MTRSNLVVFAGVWGALLLVLFGMCWSIANRDVRNLAAVLFLVVLIGGPSLAAASN